MKTFELKDKATDSEKGEYIFGFQDTGSHACYMIYGILKPKEKGRLVNPGKGHEEILLAMKGDFKITGCLTGILKKGSAFHIEGENKCFLENTGDSEAVYIIAGGHSEKGHH